MRFNFQFERFLILIILTLLIGCVTPKKIPSVLDNNPNLLSKAYTNDEIETIQNNFKANPKQCSQEYGNSILWKMHKKIPEFALEFSKIPEISDGINEKEAVAMADIYNLIEDIKISEDLFDAKNEKYNTYRVQLEWTGKNSIKEKLDGCLYPMGQLLVPNNRRIFGKIIDVEAVGFESGEDAIDYDNFYKYGSLAWKSAVNENDTDGILLTLRFPNDDGYVSLYGNKVKILINGYTVNFTKAELLSKGEIIFAEGFNSKGIFKVRNALGPSNELYALRDIVVTGRCDYRYSAILQALFWGYLDGKFKYPNDPLENYVGLLEFIKPLWGDMEGPRWDNYEEVISRLNLPELIDYYEKDNFVYKYDKTRIGAVNPRDIFYSKKGSCGDFAAFTYACLRKANYPAYIVAVGRRREIVHGLAVYKDNGKYYILDNWDKRGIVGPEDSMKKVLNSLVWRIYEIRK